MLIAVSLRITKDKLEPLKRTAAWFSEKSYLQIVLSWESPRMDEREAARSLRDAHLHLFGSNFCNRTKPS